LLKPTPRNYSPAFAKTFGERARCIVTDNRVLWTFSW